LSVEKHSLADYKEDVQRCMRCGLCRALCPTWEYVGWETGSPRGRMQVVKALLDNKIEANRHLYSIVNSKTTNAQGKVTHDLTFAYSDLGTWAGATGNRLSGGHKVCYYPFTLVISLDGFEPHYQKIFNWDASLTLVQHDLIDTDLNIVLQPLRPVFDNLSG